MIFDVVSAETMLTIAADPIRLVSLFGSLQK